MIKIAQIVKINLFALIVILDFKHYQMEHACNALQVKKKIVFLKSINYYFDNIIRLFELYSRKMY